MCKAGSAAVAQGCEGEWTASCEGAKKDVLVGTRRRSLRSGDTLAESRPPTSAEWGLPLEPAERLR